MLTRLIFAVTAILTVVTVIAILTDPGDEFPDGWCPLECRPEPGQTEPCPDCPFLRRRW